MSAYHKKAEQSNKKVKWQIRLAPQKLYQPAVYRSSEAEAKKCSAAGLKIYRSLSCLSTENWKNGTMVQRWVSAAMRR